MNEFKILIIMATYNGEKYIAEQIESIQKQSVLNWRLLIRDDGSTDETINVISKYIKDDKRISLLEDTKGNLGVNRNFDELIKYALSENAELYFFADQDDVWFHNKLELFKKKLYDLTAKDKSNTPILIHSDLQVVDSKLNLLHQSFMKCVGVKPHTDNPLKKLLIKNNVTGCAMACNKELLRIGFPLPEKIIMHDWWLALCAASCGKIRIIPEQTIQYRQHGENQHGATSVFNMSNPFGQHFKNIWYSGKKNLLDTFSQALELKIRLLQIKNDNQRFENHIKLADNYHSCGKQNVLKRIKFIMSNNIRPYHPISILFFYFRILFFLPFRKSE